MPAWELRERWSAVTTSEFGLHCATWYLRPALGRLDCADLALQLVIEFAGRKALPVVLAGRGLIDSRTYRGSKECFLREAQLGTRAEHIRLPTNTRRVGHGSVPVRPGNLLVRIVAGRATHVQVATRVSDDQRWVSIVQGNEEAAPRAGWATPFTQRLYAVPTLPQVGAFYKAGPEGARTYQRAGHAPDRGLWSSIEVREWNFQGWNQV